jgi:hypothetical protein
MSGIHTDPEKSPAGNSMPTAIHFDSSVLFLKLFLQHIQIVNSYPIKHIPFFVN